MNAAVTDTTNQVPVIVIEPPKKWVPVDFREIWQYKELLYFFVWRDVKVRYKQTGLGFAWAIIQPLFTMIIFTIFFGGLAKIPSEGIPYPLFSLAGLLPWNLFAEGMTRSTNSMVQNAHIMTKVYFPRLILPISAIISPLVDFAVAFSILILMMVYYGFLPGLGVLLLPCFIALAVLTSFSVGLWLSALNVKYRDFQYTVPFLVQLWMFASPVVYPSSLLPDKLKLLYGLNPMAGVIEGFRWVLLGTEPPSAMIGVSVAVVVVLCITGIFYFRRTEQYFADII